MECVLVCVWVVWIGEWGKKNVAESVKFVILCELCRLDRQNDFFTLHSMVRAMGKIMLSRHSTDEQCQSLDVICQTLFCKILAQQIRSVHANFASKLFN